jgi:hypothetical protein
MMRSQAEISLMAVAHRRNAEFFECLPWRAVVCEWANVYRPNRLPVSRSSVADQIHEYFGFRTQLWTLGVLK